MSRSAVDLSSYVEDYKLEVDGVEFWTPYWRDELPSVTNPAPQTGPYKGKGTPPQLIHNLEGYLKTSTERRSADAEFYRKLMRQLHLGVDCSGFVYYVLEQHLLSQGKDLADHLYKPRQALLEDFDNPVYHHPPKITRELLEAQSEQVPLSKIKEFWGNQPMRLAGVAILTSTAATEEVATAADLQAGDIIRSAGSDGILHCMVIAKRQGNEVTYAHSARTSFDDLGGVELSQISITDPSKSVTEQEWENPLHLRATFTARPVHRLKVIAHEVS